jgi:acetyl-CoA carboxylase carboxyltransferase component
VRHRLGALGLASCAAISGTPHAAWALARDRRNTIVAAGEEEQIARTLPLTVLEQDPATVLALVRGQMLAAEGGPWSAQEQDAFKDPIRETYTTFQDPYNFSSNLWVDGVLDPLETRDAMGLLLDLAARTPARPTRFGVFRV